MEKIKGSYWVIEKFNFKCSQQEIYSKYCIYEGCALMYETLACGSPCLAISEDFLHGFHRKLHKERMRGNRERKGQTDRRDFWDFFK